MQKNLTIEAKPDTPAISFDANGTMLIKGRSLPENAERFYQPVIEWLSDYINGAPANPTVLSIELEYFNSSSVKQLLVILLDLENLLDENIDVKVKWLYNQDDDLMEMKGREMASMVDIPFELESYSL
jgi:hypothetical protein